MKTRNTITGSLEKSKTNPAPILEVYLPSKKKANGMAIIIFPGGGYWWLAGYEGHDYAEWFQKEGIACFVVNYRLAENGFHHPAMLEDGLAAIQTVRSRAAEFNLIPSLIGVMGSSAGGHLAASTLIGYDRYTSSVSLRPDFGILCYAVITMTEPHTHLGSRDNLLGPTPSKAQIEEMSCELQVNAKTPPCFIWHTLEDTGVPAENSIMFATALRAHKVPFDLHIYQKGRHGVALKADFPWTFECLRWLKAML